MLGSASVPSPTTRQATLVIGAQSVTVHFIHNPRARRYLLRVKSASEARVTVPRNGSWAEAERFVGRHRLWMEHQLHRLANRPPETFAWAAGTSFLWQGNRVTLESSPDGQSLLFLAHSLTAPFPAHGVQKLVENQLRRLAAPILKYRTLELSKQLQIPIGLISIRDQRSRWGSCSSRGTVSLSWRLAQMPDWVRDYIIVHELMHRREMNHSVRFWHRVWEVCPHYREAIRWIKENAQNLKRGYPPAEDTPAV